MKISIPFTFSVHGYVGKDRKPKEVRGTENIIVDIEEYNASETVTVARWSNNMQDHVATLVGGNFYDIFGYPDAHHSPIKSESLAAGRTSNAPDHGIPGAVSRLYGYEIGTPEWHSINSFQNHKPISLDMFREIISTDYDEAKTNAELVAGRLIAVDGELKVRIEEPTIFVGKISSDAFTDIISVVVYTGKREHGTKVGRDRMGLYTGPMSGEISGADCRFFRLDEFDQANEYARSLSPYVQLITTDIEVLEPEYLSVDTSRELAESLINCVIDEMGKKLRHYPSKPLLLWDQMRNLMEQSDSYEDIIADVLPKLAAHLPGKDRHIFEMINSAIAAWDDREVRIEANSNEPKPSV